MMSVNVSSKILLIFGVVCLLSFAVSSQDYSPELEFDPESNEMLGDATPGTTPAICPYASICGFQQYDDVVTGSHVHSFIKYCSCPEGKTCVQTGENKLQRFYSYTCEDVPDTTTTAMDGTPEMESSTQSQQAGSETPTIQSRSGPFADRSEL